MVTDKDGYIHLIEYLTEHLSLFENVVNNGTSNSSSIIETIEEELGEQIISVCLQNDRLTSNQRNIIIKEVDSILFDLEEILSALMNNPITNQQHTFIKEFSLLIKNLFDSEINIQIQSENNP